MMPVANHAGARCHRFLRRGITRTYTHDNLNRITFGRGLQRHPGEPTRAAALPGRVPVKSILADAPVNASVVEVVEEVISPIPSRHLRGVPLAAQSRR